ncbi:MAG TPA: NAD-dependent epimerase/dehydratase family protein [Anaeromyxobacter sp.]|nr:NAD-dependent epimerase/dehydratase family protein [Anaeromyxobacter sp.]
MRLLVTGGGGFLGSALLPLLLRQGHEVRLLQRSPAPEALAAGVEVMQGSVEDATQVCAALHGVEAVYHLAGRVEFDPGDPPALYALHVQGTRTVLEAAAAAGVRRAVMASTSGTMAVFDEERTGTEADPYPIRLVAGWPYYLSKIFQEKTALRISRDTGLPLITLNPSLLLGPGDLRLSSTDVVWKFLERRIPAMPGGGLSFVDVRDAAQAFAAALTRGRPGERYLLGGANMSFHELFGRLERLSGVAAPRLALPRTVNVLGARLLEKLSSWRGAEAPIDSASVEMGERFWYCDSQKAREELGFGPRDPQETLADTVRWLRQHLRRARPRTVSELSS